MKIFRLTTALICITSAASAQKGKPILHIYKSNVPITIDGKLDEAAWKKAEKATAFYQNYPSDTTYALTQTEAFVTYDEHNFYVAAICYDNIQGDFVIQSLKRDFSYPINDAFAVYIDPFNDKTNGFNFTVNPLGVQREGLISGGGVYGVTTSWDNKWFSKVTREKGKWIVEMSIPFKTLRYKENISTWGINFSRNDLKRNENSSWAPVPKIFNIASLAFTGELLWDSPPKKAGTNISIIPYSIGNLNYDYLRDTSNYETFLNDISNNEKPGKILKSGTKILNAGFDAKVAVTSSLNLDLTFNPDFSQVEVDAQQTNLTRFSLFYPEKRQFFIENSDLFSQYGFRQIRPFFSRRIGLSHGNTVPIIAGARLSGRINDKWRMGLMNMQTANDSSISVNAQNYTVAALQRDVFARSNIAAIFVNRQGFDGNDIASNDYNRIIGLDYNLASANNRWVGKAFYHRSLYLDATKEVSANATFLLFNSARFFIMWNHEYVGKNYKADVGYVPRNQVWSTDSNKYIGITYYRLEPTLQYKIYPKSGPVYYHGPSLYINNYYDENLKNTDYFFMPRYIISFKNTSELQIHYHEQYTKLLYDFDVTYSGNTPLPAGNYYYRNGLIKYNSDKRKKANYKLILKYGGFYNGARLMFSGNLSIRKQPWGIFSINIEQNEIHLPEPYGSSSITLLGPKIELLFSKSLFFTTFFQYNTQINNFNINSRLQWRFKPMSDLFIVYTDNYDTNLSIQNRALVIKLIWWVTL